MFEATVIMLIYASEITYLLIIYFYYSNVKYIKRREQLELS